MERAILVKAYRKVLFTVKNSQMLSGGVLIVCDSLYRFF